jgi:Fe-only nitrogenase accessory protein AnfO
MRIASFIGDDGMPANLFEHGMIVLFEKSGIEWQSSTVTPLSLQPEMGVAEVKASLQTAVKPLLPCDAFLLRDFKGVLRVFLEECGFQVWMSDGPLLSQLDDVARQQVALATEGAAEQAEVPAPRSIGDPDEGVFSINLVELLAAGSCHVSHELIMPFLETTSFARLEVFCDHIPKWFAREFEELDLKISSTVVDPTGNGMTVTVVPQTTTRSQPRGRRPGRSGCHCG